jgi:hypothetical protein
VGAGAHAFFGSFLSLGQKGTEESNYLNTIRKLRLFLYFRTT